MKHYHNKVRTLNVIAPVAIGANATKTGKIIDRSGYDGIEFICGWGAVTTTGSIDTLVMFEGDVTGTMTSVADADMLGTELLGSLIATTPRTSGTSKNYTTRVGYSGAKRYVRVDAVSAGTTSVGCVSVTALMHSPVVAPTLNP